MRKSTLILIIVAIVAACGSVSVADAQSPDKRDLILQFRKLTGADNVSGSVNFSSDGIRQLLSSIVAEDKELSAAQRQSLQKSINDATARVDKAAHNFFDDTTQIAKLEEEVIFRIYDTSFTDSELKDLIVFYQTPAGQKALTFLRGLSARVQTEFGPVIQQNLQAIIQPILQTETEQLKQRIKELKKGSN
jgi:hypothetical protein